MMSSDTPVRSHTGRRPAALIGLAALLLPGLFTGVAPASASTEGVMNANDLELGDHTEDFSAGDFTIRATDANEVTVSEHSRSTDAGEEFTQRLQLNGAGETDNRSVQFEAEAGQTVTVYAQSGGGDEDRALGLYDESWGELDQIPAYRGDAGNVLPAETFEIEDDGTYWIASPSSGVNIYSMQLGEGADTPDRTPWDEVEAPVIADLTVDEDAPGQLQVDYAGTIGSDGGDLVRAHLVDSSGEVADEQISVSPGEGGTLALTPQSSGNHEVEIQLERHSEEAPILSEPVTFEGFVLPLTAPQVTSALTTEVHGDEATATVQWNAVPEAETYAVATRTDDQDEFDTAVEISADSEDGAEAEVAGLSVGETYEVQVTAERGEDSASSEPYEFTVAGEVQRWDTAHAGVGSGGEVTEHDDGSIEFDLVGNNSKIADSEDGFWYHYTEIDPEAENFTLNATFEVDHAENKDNQSGFGLIAVDDFYPGDVAARYFNSAGTMAAKYEFGADGEEGVRYGTPGGKFVHGYTSGPSEASAERDMTDSRAFDWEYKPDYTSGSNTNPPRFEAGESYDFTLRRSNTGFHSIWHRDGEVEEVVHYDPDFLLTQSENSFYVGLFAARDIGVTVTDWNFETVHPEDDEAPEEPPTQYVSPSLSVDLTSTTPHTEIDVPLLSNVHGEAFILDENGEEITEWVSLEPNTHQQVTVQDLQPGANEFTARIIPDDEQPQLRENQELESTDPVDTSFSVTVDSYGSSGESIWVAPAGSAEGDGTEENPLDLHTAVAYVQPGQQIVLQDGTYALENAVRIERGNSGTEEQPITLMSEPGTRAVLDLEEAEGGGIILRGDWWHLHSLEITNGQGYQKPLHIQGHHNVVEHIESHHNQDTGVQISGHDSEPPEMWPSYNTVLSSVAHNNADPQANDADGFAAKLTAGEGNAFRWTISYHNIDDGYDLYAKSTEGPIGSVTIEDSVAFNNGRLEDDVDAERTADGQGFKLGGESMPGDHLLRNAVSYGNLGNGVTTNSGPDVRLENITSVFNGLVRDDRANANVSLRTNADWTNYRASGVISWIAGDRDTLQLIDQDDDFLHDPTNYFDGQLSAEAALDAGDATANQEQPTQVEEDWFTSIDYEEIRPELAEDGSVDMNGLFELTDAAPADTGARMSSNPDSTEIDLLPAVTVTEDEDTDPEEDEERDQDETGAEESGNDRDGNGADSEFTDPEDGSEKEASSGSTDEDLAATGANIAWWALVLAGLTILGALLIMRSRRSGQVVRH